MRAAASPASWAAASSPACAVRRFEAIGGRRGLRGANGTDIEHIVALAEAHDSGLPAELLERFSGDRSNLTLARPDENRRRKRDHDAAEYLPPHNACWFAWRVIRVKTRWGLSVDLAEKAALEGALRNCSAQSVAEPRCPR